MNISARNQLRGTIRSITRGAVMAEVVDVVGYEMVSVITKNSVEHMKLSIGDEIIVVIKATEVMLATND